MIKILNSVYYMRENRCLYYNSEPIELNKVLPNVNIYDLEGKEQYDIHSLIKSKNYDKTIVGAFSLS